MSEKILLFIPCYNCAPQIGRVLTQLHGPAAAHISEVLVLDNGSNDGTIDRARDAASGITAPPITIARNHSNYHLGGSHKAAFAYATTNGFSHVIVLHGDDQGRVDDIVPVLERGDHRNHDACLGARFMRGSTLHGYSRFRRLGNWVFNWLFSAIAGERIYDLGSGLNLFNRAVFTDPQVTRASDDLRFNNYLLMGLIDRRRRILYFPITWREEDQVSNVRLISQTLGVLAIGWDYLARRRHFRTADHRERPVSDYGMDVIARSGAHG